MSRTRRTGSHGELNGFLDAGCEVQGDLRFESTFRVHGRFKGNVQSEGQLIVGEGGVVEGVVNVGELSVSGRLEGRVEAARRIEIGATGKVEGEIDSPVLVIESGAFFQGQCTMKAKSAAPVAAGKPSTMDPAPAEDETATEAAGSP